MAMWAPQRDGVGENPRQGLDSRPADWGRVSGSLSVGPVLPGSRADSVLG